MLKFKFYISFDVNWSDLISFCHKFYFWPCFFQNQPKILISVVRVPPWKILIFTFSGSIYIKISYPKWISAGNSNQTRVLFWCSVRKLRGTWRSIPKIPSKIVCLYKMTNDNLNVTNALIDTVSWIYPSCLPFLFLLICLAWSCLAVD